MSHVISVLFPSDRHLSASSSSFLAVCAPCRCWETQGYLDPQISINIATMAAHERDAVAPPNLVGHAPTLGSHCHVLTAPLMNHGFNLGREKFHSGRSVSSFGSICCSNLWGSNLGKRSSFHLVQDKIQNRLPDKHLCCHCFEINWPDTCWWSPSHQLVGIQASKPGSRRSHSECINFSSTSTQASSRAGLGTR
uniref:Uncharacterized protein n=1 Tax=Arundo donax TaxID=35708 RepID=A0A0A9FRD3_ARUDO